MGKSKKVKKRGPQEKKENDPKTEVIDEGAGGHISGSTSEEAQG